MNITKDEARVLADILDDYKEKYSSDHSKSKELVTRLEKLENKLRDGSTDNRRNGRKSQNDFSDLLKRFIKS